MSKNREQIVNKTFVRIMDELGYDVELTYKKKGNGMRLPEIGGIVQEGFLELRKEMSNSMIYYEDEKLIIRNMESSDAQAFTDEFTAQGWHPDIDGYMARLKDQSEEKCIALTAEYEGYPVGYVYVYLCANDGPFKEMGWPIIVDFNVLKKYQRKGIGNKLMDVAEQVASQYADTVCLGVGLCDSYGAAQRMYVKRGYIPDGSGVWYQGKQCVQYETVCTVDDDLILFFSKQLRG